MFCFLFWKKLLVEKKRENDVEMDLQNKFLFDGIMKSFLLFKREKNVEYFLMRNLVFVWCFIISFSVLSLRSVFEVTVEYLAEKILCFSFKVILKENLILSYSIRVVRFRKLF